MKGLTRFISLLALAMTAMSFSCLLQAWRLDIPVLKGDVLLFAGAILVGYFPCLFLAVLDTKRLSSNSSPTGTAEACTPFIMNRGWDPMPKPSALPIYSRAGFPSHSCYGKRTSTSSWLISDRAGTGCTVWAGTSRNLHPRVLSTRSGDNSRVFVLLATEWMVPGQP